MEDRIILAACAVLALLMLANMAVSIWQGRQERELRMAMKDWKRAVAEFKGHAERTVRDVKPVLDKLEDVTAQQVQDWNAVQQEIAILDGRLGTVERRFGPLEEKPATLPDPEGIQLLERAHGPLSEYVPKEEQEAKDGR